MDSSTLGLDIKKTLTSKVSLGKVSGVDKTLHKAAKNYLLLGKISHNLNLINQNIINLVRAFGIEAREKEDAHFLKEDERAINFRVRKEKYIESKVRKSDPDGDSSGGILAFFARKRLKKIFKKIATRVMLRLRKNEIFKKLVKTINRFKREIKNFFKKLDFKKIIVDWWKEKGKPFVEDLLKKGKKLFSELGPLFKRTFPRLSARLIAIFAPALASGPLAPFVAIGITLGFVIYDGIMGAIDEIADGGNGFVGFFSGIIEGITFGIFDRKLIADKMYGAGGFISNFFKTVYEKIKNVVMKSYDFISEKLDNIIAPIFEKSKKDFDLSGKEKEYQQYFEEFEKVQKRKEQEQRDEAEKETKYITSLANSNREKFERKRRLVDEINALQREEFEAEKRIAESKGERPPTRPTAIAPPERPGAPVKPPPPPPAPKPEPGKPAPAPAAKPVQVPPVKEEPKVVLDSQPKTASPSGKFSNEKDFVQALLPWAKYVSEKLGGKIPPYAILGQWAGESGAGSALPADFNYAGIKAMGRFEKGDFVLTEERYTPAQLKRAQEKGEDLVKVITSPNDTITKKGRQVTIDQWFGKGAYDKTVAEGKTWVQVKSYFAKFKNAQDFADGFASVLSNARYSKAREQTTAAGFGYEVAKAGYATAEAEKYSAKVAAFDKKYGTGGPDTSILSNAFTVTEPVTGKKIMYDSKEMFLGHREQKKPVEYDVVNIRHTDNTKLTKNLPKKDVEKVDNASILLSRIA